MSKGSDREARYGRLADAVEVGEYDVLDDSVEVRPDYRPGRPRSGDDAEKNPASCRSAHRRRSASVGGVCRTDWAADECCHSSCDRRVPRQASSRLI